MMERIGSLAVRQLLTQPVIVSSTESVSRAIGLLRRSNAYEIFVMEKNEVKGLVTIRDILKVSNIAERISTLMTRVPQLSGDDTVSKAARIMTDYRVRAIPVLDRGKLVGELTAASICRHIPERGKMNLTAAAIMTSNPTSLREDDPISKARTVMVQRNIDHLPVLHQKEIVGMLTSDAIVFRLSPPERIARESIVAEEQRRLDMKVTALMATDPATCSPDTDVSQVVEQMGTRPTTYSLVVLWDELQGIITYRDCVKLLAEPTTETLPISIVGLPEDPFEAEAAKVKFEHVVKRLAKSLPDLLEARSIIKMSKKAGHTSHYEVEVELITSRRTTSYSLSGRSLPEIFDELSNRMKRLTTKKPKPRKERPE
jgi:CBS domain-containing protein